MKRNCTIQGKMGCNGLGNRCSDVLSYGATVGPLTNSQTSHPTSRSAAISHLPKKAQLSEKMRDVLYTCCTKLISCDTFCYINSRYTIVNKHEL